MWPVRELLPQTLFEWGSSYATCARITVINVAVFRTSCEGFSFGLHLDRLYLPLGAHLF
jgi:hypothetical protein